MALPSWKLVEQHNKKMEHQRLLENSQSQGKTPGLDGSGSSESYFDLPKRASGSFRLGDKRRSWLGITKTPGTLTTSGNEELDAEVAKGMTKGRCC